MRKPQLSESLVIGYARYMWFTLSIDKTMLERGLAENSDGMYRMFLEFLGTQQNIVLVSLGVALVVSASLFVRSYTIRIIANILGLAYFSIVAVSYVYGYPNLGLGLATLIVVIIIAEINLLMEHQADETKRKIMCDSYHDPNEDETKGGDIDGESKER